MSWQQEDALVGVFDEELLQGVWSVASVPSG